MFKVNRGEVEANGSMPELLTEMTMLCRALKEMIVEDGLSEKDAKEHLQMSLDLAFMPREELDNEVKKALVGMILKRLVE